MAGDVAVAVAVAAAVLSVVLLGVVVRQNRAVRALTGEVAVLRGSHEALVTRVEQQQVAHQESTRALQLALAEALAPDPEPDPAQDSDDDVTVITDMSDRLQDVDGDLTTARIASVTLGGPLIKVAAFSHGVRRALDEEQRMRITYAVRKELRRQRKLRRRRRAEQAPSKGWG